MKIVAYNKEIQKTGHWDEFENIQNLNFFTHLMTTKLEMIHHICHPFLDGEFEDDENTRR